MKKSISAIFILIGSLSLSGCGKEEVITFGEAHDYYHESFNEDKRMRTADYFDTVTIKIATGFFEEYFNNLHYVPEQKGDGYLAREYNVFSVRAYDASYFFKETDTYTMLNGRVTAEHFSQDCFETLNTLLYCDGYRKSGFAKKKRKLVESEYDVRGGFYAKIKVDKKGFCDEYVMRWNISVTHLGGTSEDINGTAVVEYKTVYSNKGRIQEGNIVI